MDKRSDGWYEQRIRRRATRNKLLDHSECADFSTLNRGTQTAVLEALPMELVPVLLLGSLDSRWTVFGTRGVYSVFDGQANLVRFGSSKGSPRSASPTGDGAGKTPKRETEFLLYDDQKIWAPKGPALFSTWSLLLSIERSYPQVDVAKEPRR